MLCLYGKLYVAEVVRNYTCTNIGTLCVYMIYPSVRQFPLLCTHTQLHVHDMNAYNWLHKRETL